MGARRIEVSKCKSLLSDALNICLDFHYPQMISVRQSVADKIPIKLEVQSVSGGVFEKARDLLVLRVELCGGLRFLVARCWMLYFWICRNLQNWGLPAAASYCCYES